MFSKTNKSKSSPPPVITKKSAPPSIISVDLTITGDLQCDGEIQIDGSVNGDIRTKSLLIGKTANITGEIIADKVHIHGTVTGQVKALTVVLAKTAHMTGDILHEDLSIETGAFLEGHCKRIPPQEPVITPIVDKSKPPTSVPNKPKMTKATA